VLCALCGEQSLAGIGSGYWWTLGEEFVEDCGSKDHGQTEELAHGKETPQETDLWIGLAEEFHQEAKYPIAAEKKTDHGAGLKGPVF